MARLSQSLSAVGHVNRVLDNLAFGPLQGRVFCAHAQQQTESGTDVSLLLRPCHGCSTYATGGCREKPREEGCSCGPLPVYELGGWRTSMKPILLAL